MVIGRLAAAAASVLAEIPEAKTLTEVIGRPLAPVSGVGGGEVPSLFRSLRVIGGRECESSDASVGGKDIYEDTREVQSKTHTTDGSFALFLLSCPLPPLLDALQ